MTTETTEIGIIAKTQGVQGELQIELSPLCRIELHELEWIMTDHPNLNGIPQFLSDKKIRNKILLVKLEEINNLEQAKSLVGHRVFCHPDAVVSETPPIEEGFKVLDPDKGELGVVSQVISSAGQLILSVTHISGKEILLPFHTDFIKSVSTTEKIIVFETPEGLLEIYLS